MNSVIPFIQKEDEKLPDHYGIIIHYLTGGKDEFEVASQSISQNVGMYEFVTKDDEWFWIPLSSVKKIEFDKRFSLMVELKIKREKERQNANQK